MRGRFIPVEQKNEAHAYSGAPKYSPPITSNKPQEPTYCARSAIAIWR